jgi:flagellar biosynthesis/type III secretory pathway M-ring protein FliF/YscJ
MRHVFPTRLVLSALVIAFMGGALAGCGESKQDKAKKAVCSARSEIEKSVNDLRSLTLTVTVDGVKNDISSIQTNLKKMVDNQKELASDRKDKVTSATQAFGQQLKSIASGLTSNLSLTNAASQVKTAGASLQSAYTSALAPIDCS